MEGCADFFSYARLLPLPQQTLTLRHFQVFRLSAFSKLSGNSNMQVTAINSQVTTGNNNEVIKKSTRIVTTVVILGAALAFFPVTANATATVGSTVADNGATVNVGSTSILGWLFSQAAAYLPGWWK